MLLKPAREERYHRQVALHVSLCVHLLLKPQQCACRLQVLNAMLLACSGDATSVAVDAMQYLLQEGAVPDTWAPNGSSVSQSHLLLKCMANRLVAVSLHLNVYAPAGTYACCIG